MLSPQFKTLSIHKRKLLQIANLLSQMMLHRVKLANWAISLALQMCLCALLDNTVCWATSAYTRSRVWLLKVKIKRILSRETYAVLNHGLSSYSSLIVLTCKLCLKMNRCTFLTPSFWFKQLKCGASHTRVICQKHLRKRESSKRWSKRWTLIMALTSKRRWVSHTIYGNLRFLKIWLTFWKIPKWRLAVKTFGFTLQH